MCITEKEKIIIINNNLNLGGVEMSLVSLLNTLDTSRYDIDLLLLDEIGDYRDYIPREVSIINLDMKKYYLSFSQVLKMKKCKRKYQYILYRIVDKISSKFFRKVLSLFKYIYRLKTNYDYAISYREGRCTDILAYGISAKQKITWWHHGEFNLSFQETERMVLSLQECDKLIAVSSYVESFLKPKFSEIIGISIIPNMIDSQRIINLMNKRSSLFHGAQSKYRIVSVGRLHADKNFENCIFSAVILKSMEIDFQWILIGDGPEANKLNDLVRNNNLENIFRIVGKLDNPFPEMKDADVMVHPSEVESQGLVALESICTGTPVIAVRSGGINEYLVNMINGIIVDSDVDEIVEAIVLFLSNGKLRDNISEQMISVLHKYSKESIESLVNEEIFCS